MVIGVGGAVILESLVHKKTLIPIPSASGKAWLCMALWLFQWMKLVKQVSPLGLLSPSLELVLGLDPEPGLSFAFHNMTSNEFFQGQCPVGVESKAKMCTSPYTHIPSK